MALKKPNYVIEGYSKLYSQWEFICSLDEREYNHDQILVADYDIIRVCLEKYVTVKFQRGDGARPMFNKNFDKNKPITKITIPEKDTFIKNGKQYYRMICGHGDYIDLLVDK